MVFGKTLYEKVFLPNTIQNWQFYP